MIEKRDFYINGAWVKPLAARDWQVIDPSTEEPCAVISLGSEADTNAAVAAAKAAFPKWAATPPAERRAIIARILDQYEARKQQLAQAISMEMGAPIDFALNEQAACLPWHTTNFLAAFDRMDWIRPLGDHAPGAMIALEPIGVVGLITPWNFPIAIPVWKLAPALIYGNTVVLKLGYEAPRTGLHIAEAFAEAGLPAGVLNVVIGRGSQVGTPLIRHPKVRAISFTGSVATGEKVRDEATALGKRVQLELGGHNPLIVSAAADLDRAVEAAYAGAFWSAGQKCTATRRILVQDDVYDVFREKLLARVAAGKVGDPGDPATEVGPVVNEGPFEEILAAIERGKAEGGSVVAGGVRADDTGYLIAPTVFEDVADDAFLSCEEVFGPVTSLYRFSTLDEALARANAVEFGLSAAIFTRSLHATQRFANELQAGILHVNSQTAGADVHVPFGGLKSSAWGPHEQGRAAMEFYTETVTVYQDAPLD